MSIVTGVVLCISSGEQLDEHDEPLMFHEINAWLQENGFGALHRVDQYFGGDKDPEMHVSGGGFNYFRDEEFLKFVQGLPWKHPERLTLVLHAEHEPHAVLAPICPAAALTAIEAAGMVVESKESLDELWRGYCSDWSSALREARNAALEAAAKVIDDNIVGYNGDNVSLRKRPNGDVQALQYSAAIRAMKTERE